MEKKLNLSLNRDRQQTDGHAGRPFTTSSMAEEKQGDGHSLKKEAQQLKRVGFF